MSADRKIHYIVLAFILLVAALLRFYHFFELPFMWDELSAWSRINYETFSDLISQGVMPDGHPAGVQVFLYYWIHLFGDKEWVVKLPFNLMGLASVWLIYKISSIWFSKESGLLAAAYLASLQFFVLYSPIARPYSSGLFLTLMMVYFWSKYMFKTPKRLYLIWFVLFATLSAYNHHFSLLFAAIVGLSGLLIIPKYLLKDYVISGFAIFVLYTPHLKIFFHQLGIGGIGGEGLWLAKPDWTFIWDFFYWAFHFSFLSLGFIIIFSIASIYYCIKNGIHQKVEKIILLLLWFTLPLFIGLFYSIYINPVIQYSMLIFSFPYFIIIISIFAGKLPKTLLIGLIFLIISINTYQLIVPRHHFEIIQKQPFDLTAKLSLKQKEKSFVIFNTIPKYQFYYFDKYHLTKTNSYSIYNQDLSAYKLDSIISGLKEESIICCGLPPHFENIITRHFPYLILRENAYTMDCYVFSKNSEHQRTIFSEEMHHTVFSLDDKHWSFDKNRVVSDSSSNKYFEFTEQQEWGFSFKDELKNYPQNAILDFQATILSDSMNIHPLWVISAKNKKEEVFWRGQPMDLLKTNQPSVYQSYFSLDTRFIQTDCPLDSISIQSYLWNKQANQFMVNSISVSQRLENPIKYGIFEKIN